MIELRPTEIYYYVNRGRYASRTRLQIPRIGDEVRLKGVCYKVVLVVWVEDQNPDYNNHVAIELQAPEEQKAKCLKPRIQTRARTLKS
jgi:hypothetical protein